MSTISDLENFPFNSMREFNNAFHDGVAEPVIPTEFARKWATESDDSSVKFQVILFNRLLPLLFIGLIIWLTFRSDYLRWYHCLFALLICFFCFSPNINGRFRDLFIVVVLGLTIYLYYIGSELANMIAIVFGFIVSLKLTDYFALKNSIRFILQNEELTIKLWNREILAIRYPDGYVVYKTKKLKAT